MNKTTATKLARANAMTIRELRTLIESARIDGMSCVNPTIPKAMAVDIYRKAIAGRLDDEVPMGMKFDAYRRRDVPSKDSLIIANILRDCHP